MQKIFEYGFYTNCTQECVKKFGILFDLPIIKSPYLKCQQIYKEGKVLDFGAGKNKPMQKTLNLDDYTYFSLDDDPHGIFDYRSYEDIPIDKKFSLITANQVFEHISLEESITLINSLCRHLVPGGSIVITVPNIEHPTRHRTNVTHLTYWNYKALYFLLRCADLEVKEICRYSKRQPKGIIEKFLAKYISRIYRMDWCDSILIVGKKSNKNNYGRYKSIKFY